MYKVYNYIFSPVVNEIFQGRVTVATLCEFFFSLLPQNVSFLSAFILNCKKFQPDIFEFCESGKKLLEIPVKSVSLTANRM